MLYYIGLGSNLGEREQTIRRALDMLDQHIGTRISVAPLIYSEPQGFDSPNRFCNIDIDLIEVYDNNGIEVRMHTPALTLPHPRMQERQFVMEPLGIIKSHVINHT